MTLKHLSLGLAATGLLLGATISEAQAYSFDFLGSSPNGGSTDWKFGFNMEGLTNSLGASNQLTFSGFTNITAAKLGVPIDTSTGSSVVFPAQAVFQDPGTINGGGTQATYTAFSNLNQIDTTVRYQTFIITASAVPSGFVDADYRLPNGGPSLLPGGQPVPVPVPEPLTIVGSLAALGFGAYGQKMRGQKSIEKAAKLV